MRIALCTHSHHQVTRSTGFLPELLRPLGRVEEHWDAGWRGRATLDGASLAREYDAVVVVQMEAVALALAEAGAPNVTFFPMYDSSHAYPDSYWRRLAGIKVVCFSSTLHARLQRLGVRTRFVQYYPEPPATTVTAVEGLAGYFWPRKAELTWANVHPLLGEAPFRRFTLHDAPDPQESRLVNPTGEDVERFGIRVTRWFPTRAEANQDLAQHNVYFAPRLREGIGMSFLEAMAMGFLVVAPDQPTMNEYVVSGVNGILYDPARPRPLDFSRHAALGRRAREECLLGWERWRRALPALLELVATPARRVPVIAPHGAFDPPARSSGAAGPGGGAEQAASDADDASAEVPRVTVAVVARGEEEVIGDTLRSVIHQSWPRLELLVLDRSSTGAPAALAPYRERVTAWRAIPDRGTPCAMNQAADEAEEGWLVFFRPGDRFPRPDTLSQVLRAAPADAGVIIGHRISVLDGREELIPADDLEESGARLERGDLDWRWLAKLPGRPAVLWRVQAVRELRFREDLRLAPSQELLLRLLRRGARVHHALLPIACSPVRRCSRRMRRRLVDEWASIAREHTRAPEDAAAALAAMRAAASAHDPYWLPVGDLLTGIGSVPGALRELKRRLRARRARARADRLRSSSEPT